MTRRAERFRDFIGHKRVVEPIRKLLAGAVARSEPLPHLLITGPSASARSPPAVRR
jgi:Holliday junction resolvasome RuvABC ATP-dependent DNA helicase subunit